MKGDKKMQKNMQKPLLLLLVLSLFIFSTGCTVVDATEVTADLRPDKYWEGVWGIEERSAQIEFSGDKVLIEADSVIQYLGEKSAQDVQIVIRSPLTCGLIDDSFVIDYGSVEKGEKLEYSLSIENSNWSDGVPIGVSEDKLKEDFLINYYVDITWKYDNEEHNVRFYDWGRGKLH